MKAILFLDNWMLERCECLERTWVSPTCVGELLTHGYPGWQGFFPGQVFYDQRLGHYVMYVTACPPDIDPAAGCNPTFCFRLQSDDLYNWPGPTFDVQSRPAWKGFTEVVVDEAGELIGHGDITSLAGTPHAERGYVWAFVPADRKKRFSFPGFSDDGLRFKIDWEHPFREMRNDTWGGVVWNERAGLYQLSSRPEWTDRRIALVTTPDLAHFAAPLTVLQPDAFDRIRTEFYGMPTVRYEDLFIGMLQVYTPDTFETARVKYGGRVQIELAYSYNGLNWYRPARLPFLPNRDFGQMGAGGIYGGSLLRTSAGKLLIFAAASRAEHSSPQPNISGGLLYELRLDGFCSLKTWGRDGVLGTKALVPQSGQMKLNLRTAPHAWARVQLLDGQTAEPLAGYTFDEAIPISGDHLFAEPTWKEHRDLSELVGRPIRVEIALREAELFAIRMDYQPFIGLGRPVESI